MDFSRFSKSSGGAFVTEIIEAINIATKTIINVNPNGLDAGQTHTSEIANPSIEVSIKLPDNGATLIFHLLECNERRPANACFGICAASFSSS